MHWSKTRHTEYLQCPRRFYYGAIASVHNEHFAALRDQVTGSLLRHEAVRGIVGELLATQPDADLESIIKVGLTAAYDRLLTRFDDTVANSQIPVVEVSVRGFVDAVLPELRDLKLIHNANAQPVEFEYGALAMMASPEVVFLKDDHIWVLSWKTGRSAFFNQDEANLKCAAATFWTRSKLGIVDQRVVHSDIYLSEGGNRKDTSLNDTSLAGYLDEARRVNAEYSRTAKIKDFPARPGYGVCRFCNFRMVCPEFQNFNEPDFTPAALEAAAIAVPAPPKDIVHRSVFLCHCSDDKEGLVRPFARALEAEGISFWIDEAEILWGDSLTKSINKGLKEADLVICFISDAFLERGWPEAELGSSLSREFGHQGGRVLPIVVTDFDRVIDEYPLLADKKCANWSDGIPTLLELLKAVIRRDTE